MGAGRRLRERVRRRTMMIDMDCSTTEQYDDKGYSTPSGGVVEVCGGVVPAIASR